MGEVTCLPRPVQRPRIPIWIGGAYPNCGSLRPRLGVEQPPARLMGCYGPNGGQLGLFVPSEHGWAEPWK